MNLHGTIYMPDQLPDLDLFSDFPPISTEAWIDQITKELKGKSPDQLQWTTPDGITLNPFFRKEDLPEGSLLSNDFPFRRGNHFQANGPGWQIVHPLPASSTYSALQGLQEALENEVPAIYLNPKGSSLSIHQLLETLDVHKTALHLDFSNNALISVSAMIQEVLSQGKKIDWLTGTYVNDPIGTAAKAQHPIGTTEWNKCEENLLNSKNAPYFRTLGIDLSFLSMIGGTIVQQLAFALSITVDNLTHFEENSNQVSKKDVLNNLAFTFPVGNLFFPELAKFRAFRELFGHLLKSIGIEDEMLLAPFVLAKTQLSDQQEDHYMNLLHNTPAAMAAILGGAQAVVISPFETSDNEIAMRSARLCRNIQHLLQEESYLNKVTDPAGGAYYIEKLTQELCEKAWTLFQQIESVGGLAACINNNLLDQFITPSQA